MLALRHTDDTILELGVDEAGRGPLWGPMMAAAVVWPSDDEMTQEHRDMLSSIQDSKKLTPKKRTATCAKIENLAKAWGVGTVTAEEIDNLGATRANQLAFRRALDACYEKLGLAEAAPRRILIDGILPIQEQEGEVVLTIVDGDAKMLSIAAASILAKVHHDNWVINWCKENIAEAAKYDLVNCKGYGTAKHRAGIIQHGYTSLHRRLYLRKLIPGIVVTRMQFVEDN
jgi:ribonuclease HII